jgi:transcriptional regulator with XRE-family HTH domain
MSRQTSTLGDFLNQKRLAKKVTFSQLAKACKMATPTIWKVIKDRAKPKDLTLQALSEALDVSVSELFEMRDKTPYKTSKRRPGRPPKIKESTSDAPVDKGKLIETIRNSKLSDHTIEALYYLITTIA